ncbi:Eco57I restriction-modification methylase domain-containing protein, partial [uncultured Fibrella sp.]|uniref:Eco57I restriction-modification methylase domain-containing protein n=1 Tax=uncultured Fibrella sp. TaxID=1284596 RepID=UPI0035CBE30D
ATSSVLITGQPIWGNGDKRFMQTLFDQFTRPDHFYSQCLTELFFNTLNNPDRPNEQFSVDGVPPCRVPYLNGGLFDPDIRPDGQPLTNQIDLPTDYFQTLLQFFDQYNFTIDENSPGDYEVGIDPEMLGHIFENLLEENREKGAFYTPKEIVQYMCQESLIQHLTYHLIRDLGTSMQSAVQEAITTLVRGGSRGDEKDRHNLLTIHAPRIEELLDDLKICDPAIGSGAFPVGMLQEIFAAKMTLDLTLNRAEVKKRIIGESIYGVDMEPGAVDIARLRFWLSLVVDEDVPQPLPNLDYKIMQGNSLLESFEGIKLDKLLKDQEVTYVVENGQIDIFGRVADPQISMHFSNEKKQQLRDLLKLYYDPEKLQQLGKKKEQVKQQIEAIVHDHLDYNFDLVERSLERQIGDLESDVTDIEHAIRNNPNEPKAKRTQKEDQIARKQKSIAALHKQLATVRSSQQKLDELDPHNKPYFLWHLFFPEVFEKQGFDIIIANPPYLQLARIPAEAMQYQREGYETFEKTGDIYGLFYEQGVRLLRPGGILTYITSNSWLQTQYGKPLRQLFVQQTNPLALLNFADTRLFETAVVETNILLARRDGSLKPPGQFTLEAATIGPDFDKETESLTSYITRTAFTIADLPAEGWAVGDEQASVLKKLMEENGKKLGTWPNPIYRGVTTGYNPAFIIDGKTRDILVNEDSKNAEIIKPTLRGRDLRKYSYTSSDFWMIVSHNGLKNEKLPRVDVSKDYPSLYQFFQSEEFQPAIRKRFDQGDHWTNLRNCAFLREFEMPKIIWSKLSDKAQFTYDDGGHYVINTILFMTGDKLKYLLAVLNSKASEWLFNQIATTTGMGTNEWINNKVEQLPVPEPSAEVEAQLTALVDTVLTLKRQSPTADTLAYEAQIDALVFRAYGLSETDMLYVLDQFPTVGSREREMIQNNFRNLAGPRSERGHFTLLA